MYQRTEKLTVASGTSTDLIARIQSDLVPLVEAASGFIAYTIVKLDDTNVLSTRLFRDQGAMESATASTTDTTSSIAADFQLDLEVVADAAVSIGAASVLTEEFSP